MSDNNLNDLFSQELIYEVKKFQTLKQLFLNGADINYQYPNGWCLLFELTISGLRDELEYFAEKGIDLEVRDRKGRTALFWAINHEEEQMVALLLKLGNDANEKVILTLPALHYAVYTNNKEIVSILLNHGACMENKDLDNKTALDYAYLYDRKELIEILENRVENKL